MFLVDHSYEILVLFGVISMITSTVISFVFLVKEIIKSDMDFNKEDYPSEPCASSWIVLSDSIVGKSHLKSQPPIPCQDNHKIEMLNDVWGIAVVSDGLGSKPLSHIGSDFVAKETALQLKKIIMEEKWHINNTILEEQVWKNISYEVLFKVRENLKIFSKKHEYKFSDLACTVIAVVFSPSALLVTHIGDGRAGYRTENGEWHSMMIPINGETSSHVMPITGTFWSQKSEVEQYVESRVINEPIDVFTLMSDGCENFSYETVNMKGIHINKPFKDFFEPVIDYFLSEVKEEERQKEWTAFLAEGNLAIAQEADDKTMIVGILQKEQIHDNENG